MSDLRNIATGTSGEASISTVADTAVPTLGLALPPYHVESFSEWHCVCNKNGFNCLSFTDKPGVKFTTLENATAICERWNAHSSVAQHTTAVRRGLKHILTLVKADIDADRAADESRFTAAENRDIDKAITWLRHQAYRATTEPSGGEG